MNKRTLLINKRNLLSYHQTLLEEQGLGEWEAEEENEEHEEDEQVLATEARGPEGEISRTHRHHSALGYSQCVSGDYLDRRPNRSQPIPVEYWPKRQSARKQ